MLERQQVATYTTLVRELGDVDPTTRGSSPEILLAGRSAMPVS